MVVQYINCFGSGLPGYGGVERVAHELGNSWGGVIYSLDVQGHACSSTDSLPVTYPRRRLRSIRLLGRLHLPLPGLSLIDLLASSEPLHGHLPSPGVLLLLVLARLLRPRRIVMAHWHCFLEVKPDLNGVSLGFISGLLCGFSLICPKWLRRPL